MSVRKFKFVSPGVFVKEIDNSQLPALDLPAGPVIFGRLPQGPGMRPIKIDSFSQFVQVYGNPVPGKAAGDVWRDGNYQGPTYASYASQAYLAANIGSVTVMRLLGNSHVDAGTAGQAGWQTSADPDTATGSNGGAYGLFVCQSGSGLNDGSLAAIWYLQSGSAVILSGTLRGTAALTGGTGGLFEANTVGPEYVAAILDNTGTEVHKTAFNFDKSDAKFIRNVFNTNPQTVNSDVVDTSVYKNGEELYWLGETFESDLQKRIFDGLSTSAYGVIFALDEKDDQRQDSKTSHTGWFFSQDLSTNTGSYAFDNMQKLFRIHSREAGSWAQEKLKVSIQDLRYSRDTSGANPFGSFSVIIRSAPDTDNVVEVVERYSNCNLNPNSENYVARKIGDKYMDWDSTQRRLKELGNYSNISKLIRIEMNSDVENGTVDPRYLPFGIFGPPRFKTIATVNQATQSGGSILLSGSEGAYAMTSSMMNTGSAAAYTASLQFPITQVRVSASAGGLTDPQDAYFGLNTSAYLVSTDSNKADPGYGDYLYSLPANIAETSTRIESQWVVSLDDVIRSGSTTNYYWESGSRVDGTSVTAGGTYKNIIDDGYTRFTSPLYNGFDGLDIAEIEPFRNTKLSTGSPTTNYAINTIRRAIDTVADSEFVECNAMTMPGLINPTLTEHMIQTCEDRGDALAIIDIPDAYTPPAEGGAAWDDPAARIGSVSSAVTNLENREINSSYGCTYYPWVQIRDTIAGNLLWIPPSIVALGTIASSEATSEIWFAPAGFNRGGLTEGSAGLPVTNVSYRLTSKDRDNLYEANINPIATFPSEGIVIFGQKTLQASRSALDRINVRRLMIYVKKQISRIAAGILFDQNVQSTWNRFIGEADPFLASVKYRLGLSDYKLILDNTTTTPDLVDQNIVYAKIFLKPARSIEFIALDFVITNTGAGFED